MANAIKMTEASIKTNAEKQLNSLFVVIFADVFG